MAFLKRKYSSSQVTYFTAHSDVFTCREYDEEDQDVRVYRRKSHNRQKKLNILTSLRTPYVSESLPTYHKHCHWKVKVGLLFLHTWQQCTDQDNNVNGDDKYGK